MKRVALAIVPLALLTACGGGSSATKTVTKSVTAPASHSSAATPSSAAPTSSSSPTGETAPVNPVDLLKKIPGCQLDKDSTTTGQYDMYNNLYAGCEIGANTDAGNDTATGHDYTFDARSGPGTRPVPMGSDRVDDTHAIIYGDTWFVAISPTFATGSMPTQAQLGQWAKDLGGKIAKSNAELGAS